VDLDEKMVIRAIKINAMSFLYCVWAFNKNFRRENATSAKDDTTSRKSSQSEPKEKRYTTYTFNFLIKAVLEHCPDDHAPRIRAICDWRLDSTENFLMAMLINRQDVIACDFANYFLTDCNEKLFRFALRNQNEIFLKYALNEALFSEQMFQVKEIREEIMTMIRLKSKTEFILNVCLFADLAMCLKLEQQPNQNDLEDFIGCLEEITSVNSHEQNRIVLSYNPILTICLACEQLTKIADKVAIYRH
jgi:hypothetical protein